VPGLSVEWFNNIAGIDEYGAVRYGFVFGQPRPGPGDARSMAVALDGQPLEIEAPATAEVPAVLASGMAVEIRVSMFKTPEIEMVAKAIGWAQIVQAAGRTRATNRTENNPLDIYIASNAELPWPCEEVRQWKDIEPTSVQRTFARGVIFESPADAYRFYRDIFPTEEAAKKAFQRERERNIVECGRSEVGDISLYKVFIKECPQPRHKTANSSDPVYLPIVYQVLWAGKKPMTLHCRRGELLGLQNRLEAVLGELGRYLVIETVEQPQVVAEPVTGEVTDRLIMEAAMDDVSTPEILEEIARMAVNDEIPEPVERIVGELVAIQEAMTVSATTAA
jgi:type III secretion system FlhB-like substrate exporter